MHSGILNINKKKGISSAKCVSLVRKALNQKKVGHTGTLDLEASGVLPIVVGKATRVSDYMMGKDKTYETLIEFGKKTDTLDSAGEVIAKSEKKITRDDLEKVLENYKGEITQIPPMYSALKVNGKKLYDLAREGIEIERKKRKVTIYDIELLDFNFPYAKLKVTCSKGTYIRTLVDDIGEELATFAYVKDLCRVRVGDFRIEDSIYSDDILEMDKETLIKSLNNLDMALDNFHRYDLDKKYFSNAINGMTIRIEDKLEEKVRVYVGDEFIGLGKSFIKGEEYFLKMEKVFYDRKD